MSDVQVQITPCTITVPYSMLAEDGNPSEKLGKTLESTIKYKCKWADRWVFAYQMRGGYTYSGGQCVRWNQAHPYPYANMLSQGAYFFCTEIVSIVPYTHDDTPATTDPFGSGKILQCQFAEVTVKYGGQSTSQSVLYSENFSPTVEFITVNNAGLYWANNKTQPVGASQAPAYQMRKGEYTYTRNKCPLAVPQYVFDLIGKINDAPITSKTYGITFDQDTVLYVGPVLAEDRFSDGSAALRIIMKFATQTVDFNTFPRTDQSGGTLTFAKIYTSSGAQFKPFTEGSLSQLMAF